MIKKRVEPKDEFVTELLCQTRSDHLENVINLGFDKLDVRLQGMDKALELKAKDLENRLHSLNQLREEVQRDREMFLTKEIYEAKTQGYDAWCSGVDKKIVAIETKILTWTSVVIGFFAILQLALHYLTTR